MRIFFIAVFSMLLLGSCADNTAQPNSANALTANHHATASAEDGQQFNAQIEEWNKIFFQQYESAQGQRSKNEMLRNINAFLIQEPNHFQALSVRMRMLLALKDYPAALQDLQKINQLKQDGILKLSECILKEKLGAADAKCYQEAMAIHAIHTAHPDADLNYLLMWYMSNPAEAKVKLSALAQEENDPLLKEHIYALLNSNRKDLVNQFFED